MRILALETDIRKIVERYCGNGECVLNLTHYHGMSLAMAVMREFVYLLLIITIVSTMAYYGLPIVGAVAIAAVCALLFVAIPFTKAWLDWKFDFMFTTSDKIVLVDQSSIFKQHIKPIHFENIGSIGMETQWFGLFNFGKVHIDLKEGEGGAKIIQRFVPNAEKVAEVMSNAVTHFQRGQYRSNPINTPPHNRPYVSDEEVQSKLQDFHQTLHGETIPQRERWHQNQNIKHESNI